MVRLRVLIGAVLGTGLMGFGVGYQMGQRSIAIEKNAGETSRLSVCSVEGPVSVNDAITPATSNCPGTIRVLRFKVKGGQDILIKGAESALTEAVAKAIDSRTPYRAVLDGGAAMELTGVITDFCCRCPPGYPNPGSEIREPETHLVVELTWKDLRTGESLLAPKDGSIPSSVELRSVAYYRPEIGDSIEQSREENLERMAGQIASMIESSW